MENEKPYGSAPHHLWDAKRALHSLRGTVGLV